MNGVAPPLAHGVAEDAEPSPLELVEVSEEDKQNAGEERLKGNEAFKGALNWSLVTCSC